MIDRPRVIVASSGHREGGARRVALRLVAARGGEVWTELELYEGVRCLGSRILYRGTDALDATLAGRAFNETVRALTSDGVTGLEEIPSEYGLGIAEAAILVLRSGQQPHLDSSFQLSDDDLQAFGLAVITQDGEDAGSPDRNRSS